ncbi:hypothetical protein [Veillonella rogosae]|jgi:lipoprotein|uniref:hypothetical protein n=1 Tax=Veillonella rogosae TaxID=423477 RepID=UPI0029008A67|nr:hypothetical protein [Veillonella sp.]
MRKQSLIALSMIVVLSITGCGSSDQGKENINVNAKQSSEQKNEVNETNADKFYAAGGDLFKNEYNEINDLVKLADNSREYKYLRLGDEFIEVTSDQKDNANYVYIGDTKNKRPDGKGVLYNFAKDVKTLQKTKSEIIYAGYWKDGRPQGYGQFYSNKKLELQGNVEYIDNEIYFSNSILYDNEYILIGKLKGESPILHGDEAFHYKSFSRSDIKENRMNDYSFIVYKDFYKYASYDENNKILDFYDEGYLKYKLDYSKVVGNSDIDKLISGKEYYSNGTVKYDGQYKYIFLSKFTLTNGANNINFVRQGLGKSFKMDGSTDYSGKWMNNNYN